MKTWMCIKTLVTDDGQTALKLGKIYGSVHLDNEEYLLDDLKDLWPYDKPFFDTFLKRVETCMHEGLRMVKHDGEGNPFPGMKMFRVLRNGTSGSALLTAQNWLWKNDQFDVLMYQPPVKRDLLNREVVTEESKREVIQVPRLFPPEPESQIRVGVAIPDTAEPVAVTHQLACAANLQTNGNPHANQLGLIQFLGGEGVSFLAGS